MNMFGGVEVEHHAFLTSALDGGGWSALCPGLLTPVVMSNIYFSWPQPSINKQ